MGITVAIIGLLLAIAVLVALASRRTLRAVWREPVFKHPILIFESDDWGAGPPEQAEALRTIAALLKDFTDRRGRHPVMTLGVVLAVADTQAIRTSGGAAYRRLTLTDSAMSAVLTAIREGIAAGVFSPHLHGMEHYWPPALISAAATDPVVRDWLMSPGIPATETLPSHLQTRWTNASVLPSLSLDSEAMVMAVREEVELFCEVFGALPEVAVPPAFVWNDLVERAWASQGVATIVTGGERVEARARGGGLAEPAARFYNGELGLDGLIYLVRNAYFEPCRGHRRERITDALDANTILGRATLVETHRISYVGPGSITAIAELRGSIGQALQAYPETRFATTAELACAIRGKDPDYIEMRTIPRLAVWLMRLGEVPRWGRVARVTGMKSLGEMIARAASTPP